MVLGAPLGLICGALYQVIFPDLGIVPATFAVVGMAAFFTGVVPGTDNWDALRKRREEISAGTVERGERKRTAAEVSKAD